MDNFSRLINHFIATKQLGDYDPANQSITLYDIPSKPSVFAKIHQDIRNITKKYRIVITNTDTGLNNVKILDIDL